MDLAMFHRSAEALEDYFTECARVGMETAGEKPEDTFRLLRQAGLQAENAMYQATDGVNTHKGAIFTIGILCGAAGRLWTGENNWNLEAIFREVSSMTRQAMERDWAKGGNTVGHRLYAEKGIRGIRGQVADGLPAVAEMGLPIFRDCLERGMDRNEAGVRTLLHLIAQVEDTNMIARGGFARAREAAQQVKTLMENDFSICDVETLDDWFISRNLSPGGCADLLAAVYFLDSLTQ
jgi:holo-ACP synthase/triphosphoribosyl-dephospho-CoA synthase